MSNELKGRCVTCGFLAKFNLAQDGPPPYIYEMPPRDRDTGQRSQIRLDSGREIAGFPHCYRDIAPIWEDLSALQRTRGMHEHQAAKEIFGIDRQCPKWHSYTQGFSPQEHLEEIRMLELELRRQEFEKKMADDHTALLQKLDNDHKELMRQNECRNRRFQWILACIALVEIVVGLLQVLYPSGFPLLQNFFGIRVPTQNIPQLPGF